ncbi:hypothetical protein G4Y79_16865 [Phototrophicus methaneseepsis]|uniref:HTH luxR-type domain-containing protein n=1 Tax=Phototrophicus methaneseepsis TaxID=2710758 RepID=A0A7S8IDH0_9CHLR|nr:LuxR C-terminal-related transcriptional regulator [Phototrophicus methaneseepsis]QPC81359.1 hypothetical protein G4Y79_16865 [Phototrophicus methaneseepsis]
MPFLLRTKIQIPPIPSQHVYRERLELDARLKTDQQLVLVSAPAGFGKSSFLIEWAHHLRQSGTRVAWYALDERDNDPARFGAYIQSAFQLAHEGHSFGEHFPEQTGPQEAISAIVNYVADEATPFVFIIDDYHLITEPQIHEAVGLLADYMPPNMRLAIGTRADPPLQLARLRAQGKIAELRMADLRFNPEEISNWFQHALGWLPTKDLLIQLDDLTEGWAAVLALIMMSQDHPNQDQFANQLAHYSLAQRHIFDYLMQEIFENLPETVRNFQLDTCVLNRLHPLVCRVLTDSDSAPRLLNQLATQSLFVIPLSDTEPIYRYHHLFEQFLRQYLQMHDPEHFLKQQRLAAKWHAEQGHIVEAVDHALSAQDYDYVASLIEEEAWQALTNRGEIVTIMHWLSHIPDETLDHHPRLCLYFSRACYLTGDIKISDEYITRAMKQLDHTELSLSEEQSLRAIAYNYSATLAAYRGEIGAGLEWIRQANNLINHVEGLDRVRIANTEGYLRYLIGDVPQARRAYQTALQLAQEIDHQYLTLDAQYYLAQIDLLAGDLQGVQDRCQSILAKASVKIGPLSIIMLPLVFVYYQRNQIIEAEALVRDAITLARRANIPDALWWAYLLLADVMWARGEYDEVKICLEQAVTYSQGFASPVMALRIGAAEARLALQMNDIDAAIEWAQKFQASEPSRYYRDQENLVLVRVYLAQGNTHSALAILEEVITQAQEAGRLSSVMTGELLRALAQQQISGPDDPTSLSSLEHVLQIAQAQGVVRLFLDLGQPAQRLLHTAVMRDIYPDHAQRLLDIAADAQAVQHPADVLTDREIEVLALIAEGASNQVIANELVISLGTVKSHIHHIMNKLDAQNRTEAVNKARSLHILAD